MSYENRLQALDNLTLKARCNRLDQIQTNKILHGVDNVDYDKYLTLNKIVLEIMNINWKSKRTQRIHWVTHF